MILGIRPEDLEDAELEPERPGDQTLEGEVELTEALGSEIMVHFSIDATPAITDEVRELQKDAGTDAWAAPRRRRRAAARSWSAASAPARRRRKGEQVRVAVDTRALHFFDPETGLGIYDGTEREGANG